MLGLIPSGAHAVGAEIENLIRSLSDTASGSESPSLVNLRTLSDLFFWSDSSTTVDKDINLFQSVGFLDLVSLVFSIADTITSVDDLPATPNMMMSEAVAFLDGFGDFLVGVTDSFVFAEVESVDKPADYVDAFAVADPFAVAAAFDVADAFALSAESMEFGFNLPDTVTFGEVWLIAYGWAEFVTATEAATISAAIPAAESALATDTFTPSAVLAATDTLAAADALAAAAEFAVADAASQSVVVGMIFGVEEYPVAADVLSTAVSVSWTDSGLASEILSVDAAPTVITDTFTATDVFTTAAEFSIAQPATLADSISSLDRILEEAAAAAEAVAYTVSLTAAEIVTSADTFTPSAVVAFSDAFSLADAATPGAAFSLTDTATLAEVLAFGIGLDEWVSTTDDVGIGLDLAEAAGVSDLMAAPWFLPDTFTAADVWFRLVPFDETAGAADTFTPLASTPGTDAAGATESASVSATVDALADAFGFADVAVAAIVFPVTDAFGFADAVSVAASLDAWDTLAAAEQGGAAYPIFLTDAAAAAMLAEPVRYPTNVIYP